MLNDFCSKIPNLFYYICFEFTRPHEALTIHSQLKNLCKSIEPLDYNPKKIINLTNILHYHHRSALQTLYKISSKAHEHNFFAGGQSHDWVQYYENRIESERSCLNEWHTMDSIESRRPPSPDTIRNK